MRTRSLTLGLGLAAAVLPAACSSGSPTAIPSGTTAPSTTAATSSSAGPNPDVCHSKSLAMMSDALVKDGNFDKLPKLPDRSLGIPECKGLPTAQLDAIAAKLQEELKPLLLAAAASQAKATAPASSS